MSKLKDDLSQSHDNDIYVPTRTIFITGEIDENLYESTIKNLHALDSSKGIITIKINSGGGCVTSGRAIYSAIKNCNNDTRAIIYGQASSAASFIVQAADERYIAETAYMMIHYGSESYPDDNPEVHRRWMEFNQKIQTWMEDAYLRRIREKRKRFTRNQLKSKLQLDTIFTAKEALDLGLVDYIGDPQ